MQYLKNIKPCAMITAKYTLEDFEPRKEELTLENAIVTAYNYNKGKNFHPDICVEFFIEDVELLQVVDDKSDIVGFMLPA